jgi:hypothetical protein
MLIILIRFNYILLSLYNNIFWTCTGLTHWSAENVNLRLESAAMCSVLAHKETNSCWLQRVLFHAMTPPAPMFDWDTLLAVGSRWKVFCFMSDLCRYAEAYYVRFSALRYGTEFSSVYCSTSTRKGRIQRLRYMKGQSILMFISLKAR